MKENCAYECKLNLTETIAMVKIVVDSRAQKSILDSAKLLHAIIPNSQVEILPSLRHRDLSINHPEQYAQMILELLP